jgi:hypothetical protein
MAHRRQHGSTMSMHRSSPLLQVISLSQELTVGLGAIAASVRTLTDVSLSVHAGELVVLSGARGAGDHALLAVIAGDRRGVNGACDVRAHVRVRLLRISTAAARALAEEWPRAASVIEGMTPAERTALASSAAHPPEIFLLDVIPDGAPGGTTPRPTAQSAACTSQCSRGSHTSTTSAKPPKPWNEGNRHALLAWATLCQLRGGAIIMAAGHTLGERILTHALDRQLTRADSAFSPLRPTSPAQPVLHGTASHATAVRAAAVHERHREAPAVRVVVMHAGRAAPAIALYAHDLGSASEKALASSA